jgi:hypothetical protein
MPAQQMLNPASAAAAAASGCRTVLLLLAYRCCACAIVCSCPLLEVSRQLCPACVQQAAGVLHLIARQLQRGMRVPDSSSSSSSSTASAQQRVLRQSTTCLYHCITATGTMTLKADRLCNHTIKSHHCCMLMASQASNTCRQPSMCSSSPYPHLYSALMSRMASSSSYSSGANAWQQTHAHKTQDVRAGELAV